MFPGSLDEANHLFLQVIVNLSVSGKSAATFFMTAQSSYKVWILDFLEEIADECILP